MRGCAAREDVKNQFGAVEDLPLGLFLDRRDLLRAQFVVEDDRFGVEQFAQSAEFLDLAPPHVGAGDGAVEALLDLTDNERARLFGEFAEFAEGVGRVVGGPGQADGGEDGLLGLNLDGLAFGGWRHGGVYAGSVLGV